MPDQSPSMSTVPPEGRIPDGWRTGVTTRGRGVAHYYLNAISMCHRWTTTTLDQATTKDDAKCPSCLERMGRA